MSKSTDNTIYYLSPLALSSDSTTPAELYKKCGERLKRETKELQIYKAKPINRSEQRLSGARVGVVQDRKENFQALREENQRLHEQIEQTVQAVLTFFSQQDSCRGAKEALQTELDEVNESIRQLELDLAAQENTTKQWKTAFEEECHPPYAPPS